MISLFKNLWELKERKEHTLHTSAQEVSHAKVTLQGVSTSAESAIIALPRRM